MFGGVRDTKVVHILRDIASAVSLLPRIMPIGMTHFTNSYSYFDTGSHHDNLTNQDGVYCYLPRVEKGQIGTPYLISRLECSRNEH